ncbi:MAG: glycoside hydrolase N-terminal domain-containing protein [Paludibacter sp.]|nr:glycoside hydrolase N-terminal domain-containing protein [Paludibacter sp.]
MKKTTLTVICFFLLLGSYLQAQSNQILWYNKPAQYFEESLVLGNGKMGASVFGGVNSDQIYLNDATLWAGEPVNANMLPEGYKNLPAIREALKNEDYKLADQLNRKLQGTYSNSYAPLGTLFLNFKNSGTPTKYYRELNISNAISKVSYEINGVKYTREYFISNPDKIMVIRLTSSKKGSLNFDVKFESLLKNKMYAVGKMLTAKGYAPVVAKPNYVDNTVIFDETRGTRFSSLMQIQSTDGAVKVTDSTLVLRNGTEAIVFVSVATSFNGFNKNPATEGLNDAEIANDQMEKALPKQFFQLKNAHLQDYQKFFNRVSLNLGASTAPSLPTDERLRRYAEGKEDKTLEILYFQYGRYLLISSSRTLGVPANLQGIWNPYLRPPWSSNYTTNINAEENYWLAENTNLSEMHLPLLSFIKNVSETGKVTAKTFYGANGWVACHNSDIWAMSNPVGNFGHDDPVWACWNMGGAWLSTHLWEHFLFTQDKNYLKNEAYSIMRGAAEFCIEWLVEDKEGKLITSPSTSPENKFISPSGYQGATFYGGTADLAMIRACLMQIIEASKLLNVDAEFRAKAESTLARLHPYKIGKKGNLQEWYYDWDDQDPQHRHQSHLFGLFPGDHITPATTPELANACRKALEIKGDETTGWSKGWRINLWARLGDGNRAYKMYRELLRYVDPDGVKDSKHRGGGTYPNLFDAHPPFQIDGNFGGAAAVAEMLVQSTDKRITLLPALSDAWSEGSVSGICARGGFVVSMNWANKIPKTVTISSKTGGKITLVCGNKQKTITLPKGRKMTLKW